MIRKNYNSIASINTVYYFPICAYIHREESQSITVT